MFKLWEKLTASEPSQAEIKTLRGVSEEDSLSPLLFVIANNTGKYSKDVTDTQVKVKLSPFSRGQPEGSLFNSYYTQV